MSMTVVDGISITRNVSVPMRDGVVLNADIYRPEAPSPLPVLLLRIPYNKTVAQGYVYANPVWYARHGYIVVIQDCRGRYESGGEFEPLVSEAVDGADSVEWCARLPGATGKVGMFGFSYAGVNQLMAATLRPRGLAALCPGFYPTGMYDAFSYVGGAFSLATIAQWLTIIAGDRARRTKDADAMADIRGAEAMVGRWHPGISVREVPLIAPNDLTPFAAGLLDHPARDAFWDAMELQPKRVAQDLPCLHLSGWYDTFVNETLANYKGMVASSLAEQRLLVGPWLHIPWAQTVGSVDFGPEAANVVDSHQLAFFDAHLKNDRRRLDELPPVSVFVMGANRWESFPTWPPTARPVELYLHSKGRANTLAGDGWLDHDQPAAEPSDIYIYDPLVPVESVGGHSCCLPVATPMGAYDQRAVEMRNDVLCYTSVPKDAPYDVVGTVEVELSFTTNAKDTDFTAKLCHVRQGGRVINLCEGIQRLRFATDPSREVFLSPNTHQRIKIRLGETAVRIRPGETLRLEISSSNYPAFDRNPNTGAALGREGPFDFVQAMQVVHHTAEHPSVLRINVRTDS
jgi:putative CocE/NonD family hydrolase